MGRYGEIWEIYGPALGVEGARRSSRFYVRPPSGPDDIPAPPRAFSGRSSSSSAAALRPTRSRTGPTCSSCTGQTRRAARCATCPSSGRGRGSCWDRAAARPRARSSRGLAPLGPEITRAPPARSCEIRRGAHGPAPRDVRAVRAPTVLPLGRRRRLPRRAALLRPRHYQTIRRIMKGRT